MGPVAIFVHRQEYESLHQAVSVAAAAASQGRHVDLYLFWWALDRVARRGLELGEDPASERLEAKGHPSAGALLEAAKATGRARVTACSASVQALGLTPGQLGPHVDGVLGWSAILQRCEPASQRYFF